MLREGSFAALAGLPVRFGPLVLGLTREKGADVRIRKIRAMVVEESLLRTIEQIADVRFDKPYHVVRLQTLRHMAKLYADKPDLFVRVVIALRIPEAAADRLPEARHLVSGSRVQSLAVREAALGTEVTAAAGGPGIRGTTIVEGPPIEALTESAN
jgi:hypothetical protein